MKIIGLDAMLKVPYGTVFCHVDSITLQMGPLCRKVDNESHCSFRYIPLGTNPLVNSHDEIHDLIDTVDREVASDGYSDIGLDWGEICEDAVTGYYGIYDDSELQQLIHVLTRAPN